jgi:hypothetical protein
MNDAVAAVIGGGILDFQTTFLAQGTATSEILEYLSLAETEKNVLLSVVDDDDVPRIFERMRNELEFLKSGMGVAFTVSLDSITKAGRDWLYHHNGEGIQHGKR